MPRPKNILPFPPGPRVGNVKPEHDPNILTSDVFNPEIMGAEWRWSPDETLVAMWVVVGEQVEIGVLGSFVEFRRHHVMIATVGELREFRCPLPSCLKKCNQLYVENRSGELWCPLCHMLATARRRRRIDFLPQKLAIPAEGPPAQFLTHSTLTPTWRKAKP